MRDPSVVASDPEISAWVAANAGAGKTYTLANRVARLLMLPGSKPGRILCLTFTKAAAAEMQGRLFRQLGEWAMLPDKELREAIVRIGGDAHGDLREARRLFAGALETPGGLKVLTLHAFCQIVLSRFPIEAGIPPAFEVLDDQSARELVTASRQRILERAGSGDAKLAAAVAKLVTESSESRLTQILDASLGADRRKLDRLLDENDIAALARAPFDLAEGESAQGISDDFCAALDRDIAQLREIHAWLSGGSANDLKAAGRLVPIVSAQTAAGGFVQIGQFLLTDAGEPRKQLATKKLADQRPDLLEYLIGLQNRFCHAAERHRGARAAELAHAALTLIDAVRRDYRAAKRLRGVLDYDDLIVETRNLLQKRGAAGWVLYKLDGGIDHLLIDEAQDTSPEQWDIVKSLTEEFFAGSGRERRNPRTIFAVGDEKQSIFSFQGADPAQFAINRRYFEEMIAGAEQEFRTPELQTSRRSAPEILQFVDTVFASETARAGLTSSGEAIEHHAHRGTAKGGIEFWPSLKPDDTDAEDPWAPVDAVQKESPAARLAGQIATKIAGWIGSGARLPGHDAPIQPRDIMILLPRREPFGSEVIRQMKKLRSPVAGADRVRLTQQIAAMDLIALGRFVLQREDDLTLAALLRSPLCGISEEELYVLAQDRKADLWRALTLRRDETMSFAAAHDFLTQMLERADFAPPFEFYSHALTALGAREKLLARLGPESADAIEEFLSLTLTHERNHSPSLESFLDWVERGEVEIKRDMERSRNEVRVMTVHGAKGLEADIVILPDTTSLPGGLNRGEGLLFTPDAALFPLPKQDAPEAARAAKAAADEELLREHRRLFYVALTRARDRLCICGFAGKTGVKAGSWYELAKAAAQQMDLDLARGDDDIRTIGSVEDEYGEKAATADERRILPAWVQQAAPPEPAVPNPIRPSDIRGGSASFSPLGAGPAQFLRGNVVHALLARLPDLPPERRGEIALKFARANGFSESDAQALVQETLRVLDHPQFGPVFGPGSRAEVSIHAARPDLGLKAPIVGRLDRLAVSDDQVLILDFKTNRPPPVRAEDVSPVYLDQMALYRAAAELVFPNRRIVCGLLFTDGPRLLQLSDVVLDARLAGISARLDPGGGRS
ncbi:MAG TPA: double-strand break repair helicase AddA [Rhizomicrobium sp.]|nr:double-strand break repair helicase AddA [Rhizomicrobium sp.]